MTWWSGTTTARGTSYASCCGEADDLSLPRETIDLSNPDTMIYFGRALTGRKNKEGQGTFECFAWRSGDRGHTWEQVPTRVSPPDRDELRPH